MPTNCHFHPSLFISEAIVRLTGLEPARRETLDPKSNASTNSATGARFLPVFVNAGAKVRYLIENRKWMDENFMLMPVFFILLRFGGLSR